MDVPHFPPTEPRALPSIVDGDEGPYLAADAEAIEIAARYALALQEALDDAETRLEPLLPPEVRPYVEVFERYLLARAEEHMTQWERAAAPSED